MSERCEMPYHLLHETQTVKDRLLADHGQMTCRQPLLFLNQRHTTSSMPFLDTTPLPAELSQLPPNQLEPAPNTPISTWPSPLLQEPLDLLSLEPLTRLEPPDVLSDPPCTPPSTCTTLYPSPHDRVTFYNYNPYLILPFTLLSLLLLITIEIRILNANKPLLDRFDNWLRRAHKGTSRFRQATQQAALEKGSFSISAVDDRRAGKRKAKKKKGGFRGPGIVIKQCALSVTGWVKGVVRNALQGRDEMLIRSFDGEPLSPMVSRAWRPHFDDNFASEATFSGAQAPYTSLGPVSALPTLLPIRESTTSRIAYGVPSAARARRSAIASTMSLADEGIDAPSMSILRQQVIEEEEACSASDGKIDMAVLGRPRGEDETEVEDLEAQERGKVLRGLGVENGVAERRRWSGDGMGGLEFV